MTGPQITTFAVLGGTMLLFIWGRLRYDLVAILALLAALATGIVAPDDAFSGFSDEIVIIVGSALVVSAAIERSGLIEALVVRVTRQMKRLGGQVLVLAGSVALLSALVKNIGALAMLMPSALNLARRTHGQPSRLLMPMAFASLLGGLITLIGTSPNIIVSRVREDMTGEPFGMFDYAPVGLGLTLVGLIFLSVAYRLLPAERRAAPTLGRGARHQGLCDRGAGPRGCAGGRRDARRLPQADQQGGRGHRPVPRREAQGRAVGARQAAGRRPADPRRRAGTALERAISTSGLQLEGHHREAARENRRRRRRHRGGGRGQFGAGRHRRRRLMLHESHGVQPDRRLPARASG